MIWKFSEMRHLASRMTFIQCQKLGLPFYFVTGKAYMTRNKTSIPLLIANHGLAIAGHE